MGIRDWISGGSRSKRSSDPDQPVMDQAIVRWRKALSDFGYPYELVNGSTVDAVFASAKDVGRETGFVPVVLVPGLWNSHKAAPENRCNRAKELLQVQIDGRQFLAGRQLAMYEDLEIDPENPKPDEFDKLRPTVSDVVATGLAIATRYVAQEKLIKLWDEVAIVRVPATSDDELPAYLGWGGWNSVPSPEEIVAVARYWKQAFGSELVAMGPDLLEFSVSSPPPDHASAVSLLKEHYVFAPESFEFERKALEQAVGHLRTNKSWVFWWD